MLEAVQLINQPPRKYNSPVTKLPLRRRDGTIAAHTLVDTGLMPVISQFAWSYAEDIHGYAWAQTNIRVNGRRTTLKLHHLIMGVPLEGYCTDHRNGNSLDNRRKNLRVCTLAQNRQNQTKVRGRIKYRGVMMNGKRYRAALTYGGERYNLGTYDTPKEAALAYDMKARELRGEFASPNFPHLSA